MTCKTLAQDIDQSIAATSNAASDNFTFTRNSVAYRIPFSAMSASLGVSGVLNTIGAPTSVSILNKPSQGFNYIRGIAASQGITATLDPYGSIAIKTNLANSGGTAQLVKDTTAAQIGFRGITAGDGVLIEQRTNDILISTTTTTVTTKTKIVTQESDFPAAEDGVIKLADNTDYFLANDISTSNRFEGGYKVVLRGPASQIVKLSYTGSDTMFTSTNPAFRIVGVSLSAPSGKVFDMSSSGAGVFQMIESTITSCATVGTIGTMFLVRLDGLSTEIVTTQGINFTGAIDIFTSHNVISFQSTGNIYDLGTAVFNSISISSNSLKPIAPVNFINGAASSANVASGGFATVTNCRMPNNTTPLTGVSTDDARWNFTSNDEIQDTRPDALLSLAAQTTTVIATVDTPVLITGTWTIARTAQTTATAAGRITYNGERPATLPITANVTIEPLSGTSKIVSVYFYKNGSKVAASKISSVISAALPQNITAIWQDQLTNGDYYEVYVENGTDAINLVIKNAILRLN